MKKEKTNFRDQVVSDAQRQQKAASSYGHLFLPKGVNVFSPEPGGRVQLDFLLYTVSDPKHPDQDKATGRAMPGALWYKRPYKLHRSVGTDNDSYVCLSSIGKRCPICEYRAKRIREGADKEETDAMRPSLRNLYVVIPLDSKKHEAVVSIFDISQYNFQNLLNEELEEKPDNGIFPDLEEGKTLKIRFDSKTIGKGQPFAVASRIDFEDRSEQYEQSILEEVPDLDTVLKILTYEELNDKFFEVDGEEDGGKLKEVEKEETTPPPISRHRKVMPKEDPEEEEETIPPPPRRKPVEVDNTPPQRSNRRERGEAKAEDRCPYGHVFGKDTDKFDDCDVCELWDECSDALQKK